MSDDIEKRVTTKLALKQAAQNRKPAKKELNQQRLEEHEPQKKTVSPYINKLASELQKHIKDYSFISIEIPSRYKFTPADFRGCSGPDPDTDMPHLVLKATARPEECHLTVVFYDTKENEYRLYQTKKSEFSKGGSDPGSVKRYGHYHPHAGSLETTIDALKDIIAKSVTHERRPTAEKFADVSRVTMLKIPDIAFPISVLVLFGLLAKCSEAGELIQPLEQERNKIELNHTNRSHNANAISTEYISPK